MTDPNGPSNPFFTPSQFTPPPAEPRGVVSPVPEDPNNVNPNQDAVVTDNPEAQYVHRVSRARTQEELDALEYQEKLRRESTTDPNATKAPSGYVSREELEHLLAERDRKHAEEVAEYKSRVPQLMVAANAGGPGSDNHQRSWSLAEQEVAARGEILDHWDIRD